MLDEVEVFMLVEFGPEILGQNKRDGRRDLDGVTMQTSFLVRGEEKLRAFKSVKLLNGAVLKDGIYHAEGGDLYYITLEVEGRSLGSARILARTRDAMPLGADVHILCDDASTKFGELLYRGICEFERGIRTAFTIAMCSDFGQFDDEWVTSLKSKNLGELKDYLLYDEALQNAVKSRARSMTKDDLLTLIQGMSELSPWNKFFGEGVMRTAKAGFKSIVLLRNDVMHFHTITEEVFDSGRKLLSCANREIKDYISDSLSDVDYPRRKAPEAREALVKINENYASMVAETSRYFREVIETSGVLQSALAAAETYDASRIAEQLNVIQSTLASPQMKRLQEQIARINDIPGMKETLKSAAAIPNALWANYAVRQSDYADEPACAQYSDEVIEQPVESPGGNEYGEKNTERGE